MTPEERATLRELAEAVPASERWDRFPPVVEDESPAVRGFIHAASPDVVLGLLDALDAADQTDREHLLRADLLRVQIDELQAERDDARRDLSEWAARAGRAEGALQLRDAQRAAALRALGVDQ